MFIYYNTLDMRLCNQQIADKVFENLRGINNLDMSECWPRVVEVNVTNQRRCFVGTSL